MTCIPDFHHFFKKLHLGEILSKKINILDVQLLVFWSEPHLKKKVIWSQLLSPLGGFIEKQVNPNTL